MNFIVGMLVGTIIFVFGIVVGQYVTINGVEELLSQSEKDFPRTADGRFYSTDTAVSLMSNEKEGR